MLHTTASNAVLQQLSRSALSLDAGRIGLLRPRLEVAARSLEGASFLTAREVTALAYGHGLSPEATATLAYGGGLPMELFRGGAKAPQVQRLAAAPAWWTEPTARMKDLGEGKMRRLMGAVLGVDLGTALAEDPMPVPVDARYAAFAQLDLGEHWDLGVGVQDSSWIEGLTQAARDMAPTVMPLLSKAEIEEAEEEREYYHISFVQALRPHQAIRRWGTRISMVFSDGRMGWWAMHLALMDGQLKLSARLLDQRWIETKGYHGQGVFWGSSVGEVARKFYEGIPGSDRWTLAALRLPAAESAAAEITTTLSLDELDQVGA